MFTWLTDLANPTRFLALVTATLPWLIAIAVLCLGTGLYFGLFSSPSDYLQGETVRIMYVHVPAAWLAMAIYGLIALSSAGALIWRHPLADVSAKAAAPIGAVFTLQALVTGAIWGRPTWGTYWVWDARLTSMLVLFLLYLGLIAVWQAIEDQTKAGRLAAILAIVGVVNLPIIKFSVDWWSTLHQPASILRTGGTSIHQSMLWPLALMAFGYLALFVVLHLAAMRNEILRRRVEASLRRSIDRAASQTAVSGGAV